MERAGAVDRFDIDRFNNLLQRYYIYKHDHPYNANTWRTNGPNAHGCKVILNELAKEVERLVLECSLAPEDFTVQTAIGVGVYPKDPWIGVFYGGDRPTDGVYPILGFYNEDSGFFIGCVCSFTKDKRGFPEEFTDLSRCLDPVQRELIAQSGLLGDKHIAMPISIFARGKVCAKQQVVASIEQAFRVKDEYKRWGDKSGPHSVKSSNPVVQNAIRGTSVAALIEAMGHDPTDEEVRLYESLPAKLRKQYLDALRIAQVTIKQKQAGLALDTVLDSAKITELLNEWISDIGAKQQSINDRQNEVRSLLAELQGELGRARENVGKIDQASSDCFAARASVVEMKESIAAERESFKETANQLRNEYAEIGKSLAEAKSVGKRAAQDIQATIQERLSDYLDRAKEEVDSVKKKINLVLSGATTYALSKEYARKRTFEVCATVGHAVCFIAVLLTMLALALAPILICRHLNYDFKTSIETIPKLYVFCLPFYAPLLWLAFFENRRLNQSKQLKEQYVHKLICGRMYTGLAGEIKNIEKSGAPAAKDLLVKFLESTIRVYERDPAEGLSAAPKTDMPVVEVLGEASKVMHAAAEATSASRRSGVS